jgi:hypothetical protein
MARRLHLGLLLISSLALTGCATMLVNAHADRRVDFAAYRTYDWAPADALPAGDPRLDNNPFFKDYLEGAVERRLAIRGLARDNAGAPDLLIHYHASVNQRIDVVRTDRQRGYCYGEDCQVDVFEYEAGTLVLDFVDAATDKVVWRGWAQDIVDGAIDDQDRLEKKIDEAVARLIELYPGARRIRAGAQP